MARAAPSGTRGVGCGDEPRTRRALAPAECQPSEAAPVERHRKCFGRSRRPARLPGTDYGRVDRREPAVRYRLLVCLPGAGSVHTGRRGCAGRPSISRLLRYASPVPMHGRCVPQEALGEAGDKLSDRERRHATLMPSIRILPGTEGMEGEANTVSIQPAWHGSCIDMSCGGSTTACRTTGAASPAARESARLARRHCWKG
jgi:hypothetical protein